MSICPRRKDAARPWMAALRDGGRWIVPTADTVYQRAAFKCVFIFWLPLSPYFLTFGALFDQRWWNRYSLLSPLCACFCDNTAFMTYGAAHTATKQLQPLFDVWYVRLSHKRARGLGATFSKEVWRRGSDWAESALDFNCCFTMIGQVSQQERLWLHTYAHGQKHTDH